MSRFLLTGGAGFIGSNLAHFLLEMGNEIVVFDNFSTGKRENLEDIANHIEIKEGDLRDLYALEQSMQGCDGVFHLGALGSVPRSISDPCTTNEVNVIGTFNVLDIARRIGIGRVVFSASSSAYGDQPVSPKVESMPCMPISPYAASKVSGEAYMQAFAAAYGLQTVSLRYFNVFGPRQDPFGPYAAVIPAFVSALLAGKPPVVYGDGEQTRDFCFVENVCNANWLAMNASASVCDGIPMNIACRQAVSLNQILIQLKELLGVNIPARYEAARPGDIKHSLADIDRAGQTIGYRPCVLFEQGLERSIDWYKENLKPGR